MTLVWSGRWELVTGPGGANWIERFNDPRTLIVQRDGRETEVIDVGMGQDDRAQVLRSVADLLPRGREPGVDRHRPLVGLDHEPVDDALVGELLHAFGHSHPPDVP